MFLRMSKVLKAGFILQTDIILETCLQLCYTDKCVLRDLSEETQLCPWGDTGRGRYSVPAQGSLAAFILSLPSQGFNRQYGNSDHTSREALGQEKIPPRLLPAQCDHRKSPASGNHSQSHSTWTSLVAQWLRIHLPVHGTREDLLCQRATGTERPGPGASR